MRYFPLAYVLFGSVEIPFLHTLCPRQVRRKPSRYVEAIGSACVACAKKFKPRPLTHPYYTPKCAHHSTNRRLQLTINVFVRVSVANLL